MLSQVTRIQLLQVQTSLLISSKVDLAMVDSISVASKTQEVLSLEDKVACNSQRNHNPRLYNQSKVIQECLVEWAVLLKSPKVQAYLVKTFKMVISSQFLTQHQI